MTNNEWNLSVNPSQYTTLQMNTLNALNITTILTWLFYHLLTISLAGKVCWLRIYQCHELKINFLKLNTIQSNFTMNTLLIKKKKRFCFYLFCVVFFVVFFGLFFVGFFVVVCFCWGGGGVIDRRKDWTL